MTDAGPNLNRAARAAGIAAEWTDVNGVRHDVAPETQQALLVALGLPEKADDVLRALDALAQRLPPLLTMTVGADGVAVPSGVPDHRFKLTLEDGEVVESRLEEGWSGEARLPAVLRAGYHRLETDAGHTIVAAAPVRCYTLEDSGATRHDGSRAWGVAVQIPSLRRAGDLGIGDFGSVAAFATALARKGAAAVAVSPAHALYAADPGKFAPYAPSTRLFLNTLFADPDGVLGQDFTNGTAPDDAALIDWPEAARHKLARLHRAFAAAADNPDFVDYRSLAGPALEQHARFEALHAHFVREGHWHWRDWPVEFRRPDAPGVAAFARDHPTDVAFHAFCQWITDASRGRAQQAARAAGMPIGLIADLAVGTEEGGSHAWSRQGEIMTGVTVGAPPDLLAPRGQDWGLTAFSPATLRATGFAAFLELLRAAMRHAGGVRIDHAMGLARLWLVPSGGGASDGAYLTYPLQDMLRLLALESHRHRTIVMGEDLGTVPEGFRERVAAAGMLGMRVLWFEQDKRGGFIPPRDWSRDALALTSTHDLPTVAGWWRGGDIAWREKLDLFPDPGMPATERAARDTARAALWTALRASGAATGDAPPSDDPAAVVEAAPVHLGRSACALAILPIEDALGLVEQPNLPGTTEGHPNWIQRLPGAAADLPDRPEVARRLAALAEARRA